MDTEVWLRNPHPYMREAVDAQARRFVWTSRAAARAGVDPKRFTDLNLPPDVDYRLILLSGSRGGAVEVTRRRTFNAPVAVYPVWSYGTHSPRRLLELLTLEPWEDPKLNRPDQPDNTRPVPGQERRLFVMGPMGQRSIGQKFYSDLAILQDRHPEVIIHLHGMRGFRTMFGLPFRAVDFDPALIADEKSVTLPNGRHLPVEELDEHHQMWVHLAGLGVRDLDSWSGRALFNIRAAQWAGKHYRENIVFLARGKARPSDSVHTRMREGGAVITARRPVTLGDKFLCNVCSVQDTCKYFREGGVCSIPDSEPAELASFFKTRNADTIIEGLTTLLASEAHRYKKGVQAEPYRDDDTLDPELTKLAKNLFDNGVKLAKLLNPALAGGPKVGVQVNVGAAGALSSGTPNALMASIIAQLEAQGIPRDKITPEMVMGLLEPPKAIDAKVVAGDDC